MNITLNAILFELSTPIYFSDMVINIDETTGALHFNGQGFVT